MNDQDYFYDSRRPAMINPADLVSPVPGFPQLCISTFSRAIVEKAAAVDGVQIISHIYTANGTTPVYCMSYCGHNIAFYLSPVGAPACAAGFEEVIAMGATTFVWFGSCGVLNRELVQDRIIIPVSAVREEGTSYHYIPAAEEIEQQQQAVAALAAALDRRQYPYVKGKVWTTDAIYRETHSQVKAKKEQGCLGVEMECAAMLAVSQFRNVKFAQFLYTADSLDHGTWAIRDLADHGISQADRYLQIACESAILLYEEGSGEGDGEKR